MPQPPGSFPGRTALLAVLAGCFALTASLCLGFHREAAFFLLGAVGCHLANRLSRTSTPHPTGPIAADIGLLESVAKELKQALHTISGFSGMIANWAAREGVEWRESCNHLVEATRQLALFTAQLHDYARFERGALQLLEQQVDAGELVAAAVNACEDEAERADTFIKANLSWGVELRCDAVRLRQAITSLVLWVVETSPPGSIIDVVFTPGNDQGLELRIFNPSGVAKVDETKGLFELQLPLKGLNSLALPIARRVALLHCGDIRVETAQGAGTSACLFLPAYRVDWPETAEAMSPRAA